MWIILVPMPLLIGRAIEIMESRGERTNHFYMIHDTWMLQTPSTSSLTLPDQHNRPTRILPCLIMTFKIALTLGSLDLDPFHLDLG